MSRLRWPATLEDGRKVLVTTGYERHPGRYHFSVQDRVSGAVVCSSAGLFSPITDPGVVIAVLDDQHLPRPPRLLQLLTEASQRHTDVRTFHPHQLVPYGAPQDAPDPAGSLAQAGYEAFYTGNSGVPWAELGRPLQEAWMRAADAISGVLRKPEQATRGEPHEQS